MFQIFHNDRLDADHPRINLKLKKFDSQIRNASQVLSTAYLGVMFDHHDRMGTVGLVVSMVR